MSESYSLLSSMAAASLFTFMQDVFYIIVLLVMFVGLLWFMEKKKMFEPTRPRRHRRRR